MTGANAERARSVVVVSHTPSANTRALTDAVVRGASSPAIEGVATRVVTPLDAQSHDLLAADAIILGTTANFGYMSGALKDLFDRCYYDCLERTEQRPYALFIKGGHDVTGALNSVQRIVGGLKWRLVQPPLLVVGGVEESDLRACEELGMAVAAGLELGIF